ncbi:MAG: DNA-3-methyladenine glycosylase 2 family protein [Chloroflexi bacterium]|nr:MAG: DNA-3-methyladenine glycosylase 2 family protein [Chloroflexota bacterium]MBL1195520.1 DNA-3-methyladenine glycosylase 2 family protein [Chloroflexota bacterium]NOH12802.1 DNA-3-methyladenine glycosylase 2 family protein [Chloroflexota bacterium]
MAHASLAGLLESSYNDLVAVITNLRLKPPTSFDFASTAYSHGWAVLLPNSWDGEAQVMQRIERLSNGEVVLLDISGKGTAKDARIEISVQSSSKLDEQVRNEIKTAVSQMFRLDQDLSEFYKLCRKKGGTWRQVTKGMGRLLASPTVFEDVVKTICTTNIQWGGTKRMVAGLVEALGYPYAEDEELRAFPTSEVIAALAPEMYIDTIRLGYRGPYIYELASRVAEGELDLEAFRDRSIPTEELRKQLLAIKGIGAYAAAVMLSLLGRYDDIAADTVFCDFVTRRYFGGKRPEHAEALAVYDDWGQWKALAYWFDMWLESQDEEI